MPEGGVTPIQTFLRQGGKGEEEPFDRLRVSGWGCGLGWRVTTRVAPTVRRGVVKVGDFG